MTKPHYFIIIGFVFIGLNSLFLAGCKTLSPQFLPQYLGISDAEWESYKQEKQIELRNIYYQKTKAQASESDVSTERNESQIAKNSANEEAEINLLPLRITIYKGKAIMPPFTDWFAYQATEFFVKPDSCAEGILQQIDGEKWIALRACYKNNTLFLDPSRYDPDKEFGSVSFHYSPLWEQGFTYRGVDTTGYVRLKKANVNIRQIAGNLRPGMP